MSDLRVNMYKVDKTSIWAGILSGYSEISEAVVCSKEGHAKMVRRAISSVVRASSFRQMVSGFLAAGGINAGQYVAQKVIKAWRSRQ